LIPANEVQVNDYVVYGDFFKGKAVQIDRVGCGVRIYLETATGDYQYLVVFNDRTVLINPKRGYLE